MMRRALSEALSQSRPFVAGRWKIANFGVARNFESEAFEQQDGVRVEFFRLIKLKGRVVPFEYMAAISGFRDVEFW